ncbi:MAG: hypothetical protein V3S17_07160 [candidate division Zixibacteria bacterium]
MKLLTITMIGIATILLVIVGCEREITGDVKLADNSSEGCFDCHSDSDVFLRAARIQYDNSVHAIADNSNRNRLHSASYQSCERCHTHQGFIEQVTGVPADGDEFTRIECFTCHAPHSNGTLSQRVQTSYALENGVVFDRGPGNTCATCHHSRRDVATYVVDSVRTSSRFGPHHSNQSDMLIGTNAYEYSGYTYESSWHSTGVVDACISCHMSNAEHESVGGHSWTMHNEDRGFENINGCNESGCHDTAPLTTLNRLAFEDHDWDGTVEGIQDEVHGLMDSLIVLLDAANLTDSTGSPVSRVVATADSAGAVFNLIFVEEDRSFGIHNADYIVGLLTSSINFIETGDPNGVPTGKIAMISSH